MICYSNGYQSNFLFASTQSEGGICEFEQICITKKDCFERLTDIRRFYLDLDRKSNATCEEQFNQEDELLKILAIEVITDYTKSSENNLLSIATSSCYESKKHSFHFIGRPFGHYETIASWCKSLNMFCKDKNIQFDEQVYNNYQLFRCAHCCKPNDHRIKRIIHGSFIDSLVSHSFSSEPAIIAKVISLPDIQDRANNYSKWIEIGMLFAYYAREKKFHPLQMLKAFIEFSGLADTPADTNVIARKFENLMKTVRLDPSRNIFKEVANIAIDKTCNTYAEYLVVQAISNCADFVTKVATEFKNDPFVVYYLLLNSNSFIENDYYKTLYSLPRVDKSACFHFEETKFLELFSVLKNILKIDSNYTVKDFLNVSFYECQRARVFLLQLLPLSPTNINLILPLSEPADNIFNKILSISDNQEEQLFNVQFPYRELLQKLRSLAPENDCLFRLLVSRACEAIFKCEQYFHFFSYVNTDNDAARVVYQLYPFWRVNYSDELYVFDDVHGFWTSKSNIQTYIVTRLANLLFKPGGKKCFENFALSNALNKKILERLPTFIELLTMKKQFEDLKYSSVGKLLFPNGYYDGYKSCFIPAFYLTDPLFGGPRFVFFNHDLYFFASVPDYYIEKVTAVSDEIERMKDILFYQMHGKEIGNYHLESLACALFGERHKGFYVHVGDTNSGKSTEKALIEAAFGEYCGTGNTEDFAVLKNDHREATITNAFVVDNWYKRAVFFSEKGTRVLNTEMLKSHSSGGEDKLRSRKQYGVASNYSIHYKMFFYVNEGLVVNNPNDPAYIDRARYFYWNKSFVPAEHVVDPSCQLPQLPEVQNWRNEQCRRQLFVRIIIESFNEYIKRGDRLSIPETVLLSTREEVGHAMSNDEMFERLMYAFMFTGDPDHYCARDAINNGCEQLKLAPKKCTQKINSMMAKLGITTIKSAQKTICGERQSVWIGVYPRPIAVHMVNEYSPLVNFDTWKELIIDYKGTIPPNVIEALLNYQQIEETSHLYKYLSSVQQDGIRKKRRI